MRTLETLSSNDKKAVVGLLTNTPRSISIFVVQKYDADGCCDIFGTTNYDTKAEAVKFAKSYINS